MRPGKILPLVVVAGLIGCQDQPTGPDAVPSPAFDVSATATAGLGTLYGTNQSGELYAIDPSTAVATYIGTSFRGATENEFDNTTGTLYAEGSDGNQNLYTIDPSTGDVLGSVVHPFGALNGLEFVGGTLYGTFIPFALQPSTLVTVDVSTGALTTIGPTGLGPITGLAYDAAAGVMYGSTAGVSGPADLVTVNLATGAATVVGSMGINRVGSIEFFAGTMYAATSERSSTPGALYTVNTATGAATLVAPISGLRRRSITGLTTNGPESIRIVDIDIKPGSCPNPFNIGNKGVMPVAILGTAEFDVSDVDPATLLLEGVAPLRWAMEDVATPFDGDLDDRYSCHEDGRDGFIDMTSKFDAAELAADLGAVNDGDEVILTLTGNTTDGVPIEGQDIVFIIDKKK
jgi:hypothetical protein